MEFWKQVNRLVGSKRFILAIAALLTVVINELSGLGISEEMVIAVVALVISLVVADSWRPLDPDKAAEDEARKEKKKQELGQ